MNEKLAKIEKNKEIQIKLNSLNLANESISVFGTIKCNIHVKCVSRDTADKWANLLNTISLGSKVTITTTQWEAKENKNTQILPSKVKGFLIAVAF